MQRERLALCRHVCYAAKQPMTNYHLKPPQSLTSLVWLEKKAKRKKLFDEIRRRRAHQYKQFVQKKRRLQTSGKTATLLQL
jgi:hypothetical protein